VRVDRRGGRDWLRRRRGCRAAVHLSKPGPTLDPGRTSRLQLCPAGGVVSGAAQPDSAAPGSARDPVGSHLSAALPAPGALSHPGLSDTGAERVSSHRHPVVNPGACPRKARERERRDRSRATPNTASSRTAQLHARPSRVVRLQCPQRSGTQPLRVRGRWETGSCEETRRPEATIAFPALQPAPGSRSLTPSCPLIAQAGAACGRGAAMAVTRIEPPLVSAAERGNGPTGPASKRNGWGSNHRGQRPGIAPISPRCRRAARRHSPEAITGVCGKWHSLPV